MEGKISVESLIPVLDVRDVETSVAFYCDVLGFTLQDKVEWAGRTEWALLQTGKVQLMLCASQDDIDDEDHGSNEGIFFLHLDNPDAVIMQMSNRGINREVRAESQLGSKDFYLRDPDGYILWFSHRPPVTGAKEPASTQRATIDGTATNSTTETVKGTGMGTIIETAYANGNVNGKASGKASGNSV